MSKTTNKLIFGYGGFRDEDFALTPYLFIVYSKAEHGDCYGIGLAWGWWGGFVGLAVNVSKSLPRILNMDNYT